MSDMRFQTGSDPVALTPARPSINEAGAGRQMRSEPADPGPPPPGMTSTGRADESAAGAPNLVGLKTAGGADRPSSPGKAGRSPDLLRKIIAKVEDGADMADLRALTSMTNTGLEALLTRLGHASLLVKVEAHRVARFKARAEAKLAPLVEQVTHHLRAGRTEAEARKQIPMVAEKWRAVLALVDPDLRLAARIIAEKQAQKAMASAPCKPAAAPVIAPPPVVADAPWPKDPDARHIAVPKAATRQPIRSAFDVAGPEVEALAATKGHAAALAIWGRAHGLTTVQALARWHRLPASLKG